MKKIAIIGAGNMATIMAKAFYQFDKDITFFPVSKTSDNATEFLKTVPGELLDKNNLSSCDLVILGIKPQNLAEVATEYAKLINPNTVIVSLLAGKTLQTLNDFFQSKNIIRLMPNTPTAVGQGIILKVQSIDPKHPVSVWLESLLQKMSLCINTQTEDELDRMMTLAASGPAYILQLIEYYIQGLSKLNISETQAYELTLKTFNGTLKLIDNKSNSLSDLISLREQVTSKKGVTWAALEVLRENKVCDTITKSLEANYQRAKELGNES